MPPAGARRAARCPDKPAYHVAPPSGWTNDPNGLVWNDADGRFHAFYQHVDDSPAWAWGKLSWGHASSADLAVWRHEPLALRPSPGDHDAAGCWSGCCVPAACGGGGGGQKGCTLLYTGVHLRGGGPHARDAARHPPLPPDADVGLEQHECQLAAVCEGGGLSAWRKVQRPAIPHAPPGLAASLHGFRDPFVFQRWAGGRGGGCDRPWRLVLGSGRAGRGCLLCYKSSDPDPASPAWEFEGEVASGVGLAVRPPEVAAADGGTAPASPVDAVDVGEMWECPFLTRLSDDAGRAWTLVCVSPYPHTHARGRPTNPPVFWLVAEDAGGGGGRPSLDLASAAVGPLRLDLGDALYAPTVAAGVPSTAAGRAAVGLAEEGGGGGRAPCPPALLLAWLQDLRPLVADEDASESPAARADYAGCLSLPRVLSVRSGGGEGGQPRLAQAPAPGLAGLRRGRPPGLPPWPADTVLQPDAAPLPIPGVDGDAVDVELTFVRGQESAGVAGLWLRRRPAAAGDAPGVSAPTAVALVVDWVTGRLEVVHFTSVVEPSGTPDWGSVVRRAGGACGGVAAGRLTLQVLVDHSAVEAFADSGEALATRVYGCGGARGWEVFAGGGPTALPAAAGWNMRGGWEGG